MAHVRWSSSWFPYTDISIFADRGIWTNNWHILGLHRRRWVFWDPCNVRDQSFSYFHKLETRERSRICYRGRNKCSHVRNIQLVTWFLYVCWIFMWCILSESVFLMLQVNWLMACKYLHWRQKPKSQFTTRNLLTKIELILTLSNWYIFIFYVIIPGLIVLVIGLRNFQAPLDGS